MLSAPQCGGIYKIDVSTVMKRISGLDYLKVWA